MRFTDEKRDSFRFPASTVFGSAAAALVMLSGLWTPASAQTVCSARSNVIEQLGTQYAEAPVSMGLTSNGTLIEVFSSEDGATWTIISTRPDGTSCVVASGEAWAHRSRIALGPQA